MVTHLYTFDNIINIVKRENNSKRSFLFLNKLQAKYIPTNPKEALELFGTLGKQLNKQYGGKKAVIIGFAETATAIGACVSSEFKNCFYLHTTRETINNEPLIAYFEEEHSHARDHLLYCRDVGFFKECEVLIFVDDELTTGKTILNLVNFIKKHNIVSDNVEMVVGTLVNCMSNENIKNLKSNSIYCESLVEENRNWDKNNWVGSILDDAVFENKSYHYEFLKFPNHIDTRKGTEMVRYKKECNLFVDRIFNEVKLEENTESILVIGTEEFMYPAILAANKFMNEYKHCEVLVQATSRSPIFPMDACNYVVKNRTKIKSIYDDERTVYLYNLRKYDKVLIITDSQKMRKQSIEELISALNSYNNKNITLIQWEEL